MAMFGVWRELLIRGKVYLFGRLRNNLFTGEKRAPEKWIKDSLTFLWRNRQNLFPKSNDFLRASSYLLVISAERLCCCLIKRIKWALWGKKVYAVEESYTKLQSARGESTKKELKTSRSPRFIRMKIKTFTTGSFLSIFLFIFYYLSET